MWTKIIQHRLALLVGALVIAVALTVLPLVGGRAVAQLSVALPGLLSLVLLVVSLVALNARRPTTFLVRDGGFATLPDAGLVLSVAMLTLIAAADADLVIVLSHLRFGFRPGPLGIGLLALICALLPLAWYRVLGPFGAVLRPDGLLDRQPLGSMFVPWEAGPEAIPTTAGVKLRFARPDLVQWRGFRPGKAIRTGADRGFTAWAINLYASRPDYRPTIGTDEGLLLIRPR